MNTTSASDSTAASDGAGSNVWLFVPSGTMPVIRIRSPPTFWTMFVIGATVVTTRSRPSSALAPPAAQAGRSAVAISRARIGLVFMGNIGVSRSEAPILSPTCNTLQ